jgi:hypothetical protein
MLFSRSEIMEELHSVEDVLAAAKDLRDSLNISGHGDAAKSLDNVLNSFWTTTSEFLVELLNALQEMNIESDRDREISEKITTASRRLLHFQ